MKENSVDFDSTNTDEKFEYNTFQRTNFLVSFVCLFFEVLIPGCLMFLLTSRDFNFSFQLSLSWMFSLTFLLLFFSLICTFITYKCKLHQIDQFSYVLPFIGFISALYLSGYWLNNDYFLIRFIIAFAFSILFLLVACIIILVFFKKKKKAIF